VFYDHFAKQSITPIGNWITQRAGRRQLTLIQPFLPGTGCAILEIGPGLGVLAELFMQKGYCNYTAVEPNVTMRAHLVERGIRSKSYRIPLIDEEDHTYDLIILSHVFEHLDGTSEARIFMREAQRVLQPGGHLCIISPDYLHLREDFFNVDYTHSNITTLRRTIQLFRDNGFRVVKSAYLSGFFGGPLATVVSYLFRLGLFFCEGNRLDAKLYKLKTTFLRSFLVIGEKQKASKTSESRVISLEQT
jgi:SAM-dependent methyltransferase